MRAIPEILARAGFDVVRLNDDARQPPDPRAAQPLETDQARL